MRRILLYRTINNFPDNIIFRFDPGIDFDKLLPHFLQDFLFWFSLDTIK